MPIHAVLYILALSFFFLPTSAGYAGVHTKEGSSSENPLYDWQCNLCHTSDPFGQVLVFESDSMDHLCQTCHPEFENNAAPEKNLSFDPGRNAHASLVTPDYPAGTTIPSDLWLDALGRVNCATCHDPHPKKISENLLRGKKAGNAFCQECHTTTDTHAAAVSVAHSKARTEPDPSGTTDGVLDKVSQSCEGCHDGTTDIPRAAYCVLGREGQCAGHIIGMDYDNAVSESNGALRSSLDPRISLYEGKVGCASCHNIYSDEPKLLVFSNSGSALCFACHDK